MDPLLDIGLRNAVLATVMAIGAAWLGRSVRRPALTHGLWVLVLLKLVAPPLVTWPVAWPSRVENSTEVAQVDAPDAEGVELDWLDADLYAPAPYQGGEQAPAPPLDKGWVGGVRTTSPSKPLFPWRSAITMLWLSGSALWLAASIVRIVRFHRALHLASPASPDLAAQVAMLSDRLGMAAAPDIRLVRGAISPLVWALGKTARLLIPAELWDRLDTEQRTTLLIHELAHLRRRDHWVRALELVATGLYWWHPVVWWARRAMREAEEQCCDAWVVWAEPKAARAYATALLETVDFLTGARPVLPPAASGIGHVTHLKRRLIMIFQGMTPKGLSWAGRLTILGLAGILLPLAPTAAQDPPAPPPAPGAPPAPSALPFVRHVEVLPDVDEENLVVTRAVVVSDDEEDDKKEAESGAGSKRDQAAEEKAKAEEAEVKAELDKARAELREAQERVTKAARRVAELQRKRVRARNTIRTEDGRVVIVERAPANQRSVRLYSADGRVRALPDTPLPPERPGQAAPIRNLEKRMSDMEKKLDKLMDELKRQRSKE